MSPPPGFKGQWFDMKTNWVTYLLLGLLARFLLKNKGIGVNDEGITLKGFGTKVLPWHDIEAIRPLGAGALGLLMKPFVVDSKSRGTLMLPIHQTHDPAALVTALEARGFNFGRKQIAQEQSAPAESEGSGLSYADALKK